MSTARENKHLRPWLRDYICGCAAGAANVVVGAQAYSMLVLSTKQVQRILYHVATGYYLQDFRSTQLKLFCKARMESCPVQLNAAHISCAPKAMQPSGFFTGVSAPLYGGALECGVNYLTYNWALARLKTWEGNWTPASYVSLGEGGSHQHEDKPLWHVTLAAAFAGFCLTPILSPVELIKCRMQVNAARYNGSALVCLRMIVNQEGYSGLLRGLGATFAREVPGNALFFTVYEMAKKSMHLGIGYNPESPHDRLGPHDGELARHAGISSDYVRRMAATITSGGLAGCVMWDIFFTICALQFSVLPVDSAKTRIQASHPGEKYDVGLISAMRTAWLEGGVRSWWSGLSSTLVRAFPANAAQWLAWEMFVLLLSSH